MLNAKKNKYGLHGIRKRILVSFICMLASVLITTSYIQFQRQTLAYNEELEWRVKEKRNALINQGKTLSNFLKGQVTNEIAAFNFSRIIALLNESVGISEELSYAILLDIDGNIITNTSTSTLFNTDDEKLRAKFALLAKEETYKTYDDIDIVEYIIPISFGEPWGVLRLGFSTKSIRQDINFLKDKAEDQKKLVLYATLTIFAIFFILSSIISVILSRSISLPIEKLTKFVQSFNKDTLATTIDSYKNTFNIKKTKTESDLLAIAFIKMAEELFDYHMKIKANNIEIKTINKNLKNTIALKEQFLSTISHELRTPINSINVCLELLKNQYIDDSSQQLIKAAITSTNLMYSHVDKLIKLSDLKGGGALVIESFNVFDLFTSICQDHQNKAKEKNLHFSSDIASLKNTIVKTDRSNLEHLAQCLLENAYNFTNNGEYGIKVVLDNNVPNSSSHNKDFRKSLLTVEVFDTGEGIDEQDLKSIFDPFRQVDQTAHRKIQGLGIGLSLCKKMIELLDGKIDIQSTKGQGTRCIFSFELESQQDTPKSQQTTIREGVGFNNPVLIVEDNAINLLVLEKILKSIGVHYITAKNGVEALEKVEKDSPQLILMDCQMPIMDGYQATRELRTRNITIPVVAVTANVSAEDRRKCIDSGMDDFISKPINLNHISNILKKWIMDTSNLELENQTKKQKKSG